MVDVVTCISTGAPTPGFEDIFCLYLPLLTLISICKALSFN